jgi:DNA-binding SARP family transcriptional activator/tetratricopeptide (TPR) repeat protein
LRQRCTGEKTKVSEEKPLSIRVLGLPEVSFEGRRLRFGRKKVLALLCYLAAEGGMPPRRELAELLWPQSDERHARTGLRSTLARLRKTLGEGSAPPGQEEVGFLVIEGELLGLAPHAIYLDLKALEAAVALSKGETSPAGSSSDAVERRDLIGRLEGGLGLYRGEFMEGFTVEDAPEFELWVEAERSRWRRVFGELCERLSRLQVEAAQLDGAIATARVWVRHAPLEEGAHRRLMELFSSAGESEKALFVYEDYRDTLSRGLSVEPSAQMQELADRLQAEVQERASLGASLARSGAITTSPLSELDVPLVDRHEEFGALVSEYHAASAGDRGGETHVVAVLGEAGIGKTRLAEEFLLWARVREADVLKGGASEEAGLPYGPLVEAIRLRIERERAPDDLLEDVWLSELSRLLPELKERYPDLPLPTSGEGEIAKVALFEAIARLVGALTSRAPVVLFLDDLQWADAATLEVLEYAGGRWAEQGTSVLVLIAARPEEPEAGSAFERWLSSLGRRVPVRSLSLGPLGDKDVEGLLSRLAARAVSSSRPAGILEKVGGSNVAEPRLKRLGKRLALETEGQPFYLVETFKALLEEGKLLIRSRTDGEPVVEVAPALRAKKSTLRGLLPKSVREVVRSRLSRLSASAYELLRAGAMLERGFSFETVVGVAGLEEAESLWALEELIERRLLREEVGGQEEEEPLFYRSPTYSFTHEKIRQVAYTEMGHARRRLLHRRAFEVLEASVAPAAQLARHALAGGLAEPFFRYSVVAGDQAVEVFAARDAIEHYQRAHDLLAEKEGVRTGSARQLVEPPIPELEHLYTQLGRAYEMADEWEKAKAAYETMLALGRDLGEARLEVVALNSLAILALPHQREADLPKAKALLEEARGVAEEAGLEEALVETECNLADFMTLWAGEHEHAGPLARKALASARIRGRPHLVARALLTLTRLELLRGRFEESAAYAEEGAAVSQELAQRPPPRRLVPSMGTGVRLMASWRAGTKMMAIQCLSELAWARIFQGRLREGIEIARQALGISRELPAGAEMEPCLVLGIGLVEIGEYEEGLELCRRNTDRAREAQNASWLWVTLDNLGRAYEALLDLEEARRVHEEALELSRVQGPLLKVYSSIRLCAVAALSEDWEEAYARAKRAHEGKTSLHVLDGFYLHHEVEALLRGGDERSAREEARRFADRAEVNERERVAYLCSLADLSEFEGNTGRAIGHLQEARALAQKIGVPGELWQIQSRLGVIHERCGEIEEAREAFSRAAQTLRELAQKIEDEELREGFLAAPQVRRVLVRD